MGRILGKVIEINRYPVKSLAGETMARAELAWQGIEGDRQYGFYFADDGSRFPWATGRDLSRLVTLPARYRDPNRPKTASVDLHPPGEAPIPLDDPAFIERLAMETGRPVGLIRLGRGAYDAMPVSVITTASLAEIDRVHGTPLDRRRFRINIIVESDERESDWRGRRIAFDGGATALQVAAPIQRCVMTTIDPDTGQRDPSVMRTIARHFGNCVGVYSSTAAPGSISVGDMVELGD